MQHSGFTTAGRAQNKCVFIASTRQVWKLNGGLACVGKSETGRFNHNQIVKIPLHPFDVRFYNSTLLK